MELLGVKVNGPRLGPRFQQAIAARIKFTVITGITRQSPTTKTELVLSRLILQT